MRHEGGTRHGSGYFAMVLHSQAQCIAAQPGPKHHRPHSKQIRSTLSLISVTLCAKDVCFDFVIHIRPITVKRQTDL
jgi:hypothetical protein